MTNEFAAKRLTRRGFAAMAGAAAVAVAGQHIVSAQQAGGEGAGSGPGYGLSGGAAGITVTGNGRATAEVESGVLQLLVRFGPESEAMMNSAGSGGYYGGVNVPAPDEDALTNVVNALIEAGIPEDQVLTSIGSSSLYGMFGAGVSVVAAGLDAEAVSNLGDIVEAATAAGRETDLAFDQVGVVFATSDCDAVSDDAYLAAIEDGRVQAEAVARALGVELGDLVGVSASMPWSAYSRYDGGGSGNGCAAPFELEDAFRNYFQSYMPGTDPVFALSVSITMTFDFAAPA
jgi:hypothetical protein